MYLHDRTIFNSFDLEPHWVTLPVRHSRLAWNELDDLTLDPTKRFIDLCLEFKQHCTFFVVGAYARKHPKFVNEISSLGFEIASHSMWHEDMALKSEQEFVQDARESKEILEDIISKEVKGFRAPSFSIKPEQLMLLAQAGYKYDASTSLSARIYGGSNTGATLTTEDFVRFVFHGHKLIGKELTLFGGGYLRLLPEKIIPLLSAAGTYNGIYLHPHDLSDGYKKEAHLNFYEDFKRRLRLGSLEEKLRLIYKHVELSSFESALS